ncbi:serine/arginine repetitive matrix protein 1 isoform X1 [Octopus bimaculoides]|uniref:Uncharacterized protein n=1 Tax=Octopus bimaculoides TaxID=37653 RepID=A0A0L8IHZ1_OCTBM|nr:serine/arginine repetitive matrix protein 1 isoform X1 [Octopus bimaculoides]
MRKDSKRIKKDVLDTSRIYKPSKKQTSDIGMKSKSSFVKSVTEDIYYTDMQRSPTPTPKPSKDEPTEFETQRRPTSTPKPRKDEPTEFETQRSPTPTPKPSKDEPTEFETQRSPTPTPRPSKDEPTEFEMQRSPTPKSRKDEPTEFVKKKSSRSSREHTTSAEEQPYHQGSKDSWEFLSDTDMKSRSGTPFKEFLSDTEMDKPSKTSTAKVTSSLLLQCKSMDSQKGAQVKQAFQKKIEFMEKFNKEKMALQMQNLKLQNDMDKLIEQNKDLFRKIRVLEQSRMIEPRKKYKIIKECTLTDVPDMGYSKTNFYEKKIQILQHSYNALRNEMYTRQTLQRQSCMMHHAGITYKITNHLPAKEQPMQVKLCSTDITSDKDGNIIPNIHYEVPHVPCPSFAEIAAADA